MDNFKSPSKYDFKLKAEECFKSVFFSSIASTDGINVWNSILWLAKDENWNLYFRSKPGRNHILNIAKNNNVSIAIYDSKQIDSITGLQITGTAEILNSAQDIEKAMKYYHNDKNEISNIYTEDDAKYVLVKITPVRVFIYDQSRLGDNRVEIMLKDLRAS